MEKIVRITEINKQDDTRREDVLRMTPEGRVEALIRMRDQLYPYEPLKRVVTIRKLI